MEFREEARVMLNELGTLRTERRKQFRWILGLQIAIFVCSLTLSVVILIKQ